MLDFQKTLIGFMCGLLTGMWLPHGTVAAQNAVVNSIQIAASAPIQQALQQLHRDDVPAAMQTVAEVIDSQRTLGRSVDPFASTVAAALHRRLANLSARDRFKLLSDWIFPSTVPTKIRGWNEFTTDTAPPREFARALGERPSRTSFVLPSIGTVDGLFSTAWLLVTTAEEEGTVRSLVERLEDLAQKNVRGAEDMLLLCRIVAARSSDETLTNDVQERLRSLTNQPVNSRNAGRESAPLEGCVLATACLTQSSLRPIGVEALRTLIEAQKRGGDPRVRVFARRALLRGLALMTNDGDVTESNLLQESATPRYWVPASLEDTQLHTQGSAAPIWLAHEDQILHLTGRHIDFLCFRYPLTGDYTFRFEGQDGGADSMACGLTWNGLSCRASGYSSGPLFSLWSLDKQEQQERRCPFLIHEAAAQFNRFAVSFGKERSTILINGQTMYHDKIVANGSPWIGLRCAREFAPLFRNLKITGNPVIPREVRITDEYLRGWVTSYFGESRSPALPQPLTSLLTRLSSVPPEWTISQGEISRRAVQPDTERGVNNSDTSRLYYFRPLQNGESVSYEFRQEANEAPVFPALDRLGYMMEPGGVRLHWITDPASEWTGLESDNAVSDPLGRRGPAKVRLLQNEWNKVSVSITDGTVTLILNGDVIFERPLEADNNRQFGFFTRRQQSARIRNVVLSGDWPEKLSDDVLQHPAAPVRLAKPKERRLLTSVFGDQFLAENVDGVRQRAAAMSAPDRFLFLSEWVLPGPSREAFRLNGTFSPLSPAPPVALYTAEETARLEAAAAAGRSRVLVGGSLFAPAIDLVELALQTGRLDELRDRVAQDKNDTVDPFHHDNRARLALLGMIELAAENHAAADDHFRELCDIAKAVPIRQPHRRWPEMLAFWQAARHRETFQTVSEVLYQIVFRDIHAGRGTGSELWDRHLLALTGFKRTFEADDANTAADYFDSMSSRQWAAASFDSAFIRGRGIPGARWVAGDHGIMQNGGQENDFVYFQSPLTGNYEVDCQTTSFDWRECEMFFAGRWVGPAWGMTHYEMGDHRRTYWKPSLARKMASKVGDFFHVRVTAKDGVAAISANGRTLFQTSVGPDHDPWIGARVWHRYHGGIRDVRITGTPVIPDSINLLYNEELTGWAAYYSQVNFLRLNTWHYDGQQLLGDRIADPDDVNYERLLRYHRPMLEDGSIDYEFYYQPGEVARPSGTGPTHISADAGGCPHSLVYRRIVRSHGPVTLECLRRTRSPTRFGSASADGRRMEPSEADRHRRHGRDFFERRGGLSATTRTIQHAPFWLVLLSGPLSGKGAECRLDG